MVVRILQDYRKWKPGDKPDLHRDFAKELIAQGIAQPHGGIEPTEQQETADMVAAKNTPPQQPAVVVVNQTNSRPPRARRSRKKKE